MEPFQGHRWHPIASSKFTQRPSEPSDFFSKSTCTTFKTSVVYVKTSWKTVTQKKGKIRCKVWISVAFNCCFGCLVMAIPLGCPHSSPVVISCRRTPMRLTGAENLRCLGMSWALLIVDLLVRYWIYWWFIEFIGDLLSLIIGDLLVAFWWFILHGFHLFLI